MANRTVKDAHSVKGTNPQYLVEKIIRTRIYESRYWKEECFALTAELVVDKAMELKYVGGIYGGNVKPTPFLCLVLKMLQIQPEKDIIIEFIKTEDFKYVRALGAIYMRIVGTSLDCYKYLEPLYLDYRKLRRMNRSGVFEIVHMDEFIDELLREERVCDVIMPRIQKRQVLEETNQLDPRISGLDEDAEVESEEEEDMHMDGSHSPTPERLAAYKDWDRPKRSPSPRYRRSRSPSPHRSHRRSSREREKRSRSRERHREHRDRDREREHHERRRRSRSREKEKHKSSRHRHHDDEDTERRHRSKRSKRDRDDHRERSDHRSSKKSSKGSSHQDPDIAAANAVRASLGLAPLRP